MTGEDRPGTLELCIPADPALALTARMFAGAVSSHLPETVSPDDLKLAFSELLATAIDVGATDVIFRVDLDGGEVTIDAVGGCRAAQAQRRKRRCSPARTARTCWRRSSRASR